VEFSRSDARASVAKAAAAASTIIWKRNTSVSAGWIRETLIYSISRLKVSLSVSPYPQGVGRGCKAAEAATTTHCRATALSAAHLRDLFNLEMELFGHREARSDVGRSSRL
jgi:hypothetical protein